MRVFTIYDPATGRVLRTGTVANDLDADQQAREGEAVLLDLQATPDQQVVDGELVDIEVVPPTLSELKAQTKARLANRRWEVETGGMPFSGATLATDDRSKLLLSAAAAAAQADPNFTTEWKMQDGTWVTLDAAALIAAYQAAFGWVAQCFGRELALGVLIDAAEDAAALEALTSTLDQFWP